jgi:hypothetical protein
MAEDRQKRAAAQEQLIKNIVRDALDAIDERGGDVFFLELVRDFTKILISKRPGFSPTYAGDQFIDSRCNGFKERIEAFAESPEEECDLLGRLLVECVNLSLFDTRRAYFSKTHGTAHGTHEGSRSMAGAH